MALPGIYADPMEAKVGFNLDWSTNQSWRRVKESAGNQQIIPRAKFVLTNVAEYGTLAPSGANRT